MKDNQATKQLFQNPILERFSRTKTQSTVRSLYLLSLSILIFGLYITEFTSFTQVSGVIAGLVAFSFVEYLIHRFVFHFGDYRDTKNWQSKIHGIHHDYPSDRERLALPIPLALFISFAVFLLFRLMIGDFAFVFFPGFISGYASYLLVHYIIHTRRPPRNRFKILWRNHHIHHHINEHKAYGVTSPFWDWIFRTMP